ncbi:MAG TPA: cytochrome c-type biogenesis protein [Burkholderiales bacterium]|nr:cytochrome c-type biogenesis protein [Burkholderiales bacterium]
MRNLFAVFALLFAVQCVGAAEAAPAAGNPQVEKRVMTLAEELRCLVCQNQSLADSHADLAVDLRNQVREKVKQGMSDRQIVDYMVERYGDFVLYRPPVKMTTLLLWFGPLLLVLIGVAVLYRTVKMRPAAVPPLSDAEHERAQHLLRNNEGESV